jgi:antirestriction protein ArdC
MSQIKNIDEEDGEIVEIWKLKDGIFTGSSRMRMEAAVKPIVDAIVNKNIGEWMKGYASVSMKTGGAINCETRRRYRGMNHFLLSCWAGGSLPVWGTYKAWKRLSDKQGNGEIHLGVQKGGKGHPCFYYGTFTKERTNEKGKVEKDTFGFVKHYTVFNVSDTKLGFLYDDLLEKELEVEKDEKKVHPVLEKAIEMMDVGIDWNATGPHYRPSNDTIGMPPKDVYFTFENMNGTLAHELGHASGSKDRLAREGIIGERSTESYAWEELIAELCAVMVSAIIGFDGSTLRHSAEYLDGWSSRLKGCKTSSQKAKKVLSAFGSAEKAANFILSKGGFEDDFSIEGDDLNE